MSTIITQIGVYKTVMPLMLFLFTLFGNNGRINAQTKPNENNSLSKEQALQLFGLGVSLHEAGDYVQSEAVLLKALDAVRKSKVGQFWEASCFEQLGVVYRKSGLAERSIQFFKYALEVLNREVPITQPAREANMQRRIALERMVVFVQQNLQLKNQQPNDQSRTVPTSTSNPIPNNIPIHMQDRSAQIPVSATMQSIVDSTVIARYVRREVELLLAKNSSQNESQKMSKDTIALANVHVVDSASSLYLGGFFGVSHPILPAGTSAITGGAYHAELVGEYRLGKNFLAIGRVGGVFFGGYSATSQTLDNQLVLAPNFPTSNVIYSTVGIRYMMHNPVLQPYADLSLGFLSDAGAMGFCIPLSVGVSPILSDRLYAMIEFQILSSLQPGGVSLNLGLKGGIRYRWR